MFLRSFYLLLTREMKIIPFWLARLAHFPSLNNKKALHANAYRAVMDGEHLSLHAGLSQLLSHLLNRLDIGFLGGTIEFDGAHRLPIEAFDEAIEDSLGTT